MDDRVKVPARHEANGDSSCQYEAQLRRNNQCLPDRQIPHVILGSYRHWFTIRIITHNLGSAIGPSVTYSRSTVPLFRLYQSEIAVSSFVNHANLLGLAVKEDVEGVSEQLHLLQCFLDIHRLQGKEG